MKWLLSGLLGFLTVTAASGQGYGGYPPPYASYYAPYPASQPVVVINQSPPVIVNQSPPVVIREYPPRQITYMIAFKDSVVRLATAYWVSGTTLYYVTTDHKQKTAPLATVDRGLSERLNGEQQVAFTLPFQPERVAARMAAKPSSGAAASGRRDRSCRCSRARTGEAARSEPRR